jgi:hypothetical protein
MIGTEKKVYFKDDTNLHSLDPLKNLIQGQYFSMMFDSNNTKGINPTAEYIYQKNRQNWYRLIKNNDTNLYTLEKEYDKTIKVPNGLYEYLIIIKYNNKVCDLKIGKMAHFYLNDKLHNGLVVAGEICFKQISEKGAEIEFINDKSGGYHLKDDDKPILEAKKFNILTAIQDVGLPVDKFVFQKIYKSPRMKRRISL